MKNNSILTEFIKCRYIWDENGILNTVFSVDNQEFYTSVILEKCNAGTFKDWVRSFGDILDEDIDEDYFNGFIDDFGKWVNEINKMFPNSIVFVDKRGLKLFENE